MTVSYGPFELPDISLPLGRNALTLTTTLTFPPGASILPIGVMLPSLDRSEGVEADDRTVRISAATPGTNRGSRAIASNKSLASRSVSWNLCWRGRYMNSNSALRTRWPHNVYRTRWPGEPPQLLLRGSAKHERECLSIAECRAALSNGFSL